MATWTTARERWASISPRAQDAACILVAGLSALAEALARRDEGGGGLAVAIVVGLVGTVSLVWRRSHPAAVTLVGAGVQLATVVPIVLAIGVLTLANQRRDRVLVGVALVAAASISVASALDEVESWSGVVLAGVLPVGLLVALGAYAGTRRELVASLRDRAARAEAEQELRADQARLAERARIAREMHDVLAHKVSLIALHAGALEVQPDAGADRVREAAELIRTTAREAVDDLRDVLGVLRAGAAEGERLETALTPPARTEDLQRIVDASVAAGVPATLTAPVPPLPDALARAAHRVVREGLTNVHKHAGGAATTVSVTGGEGDGLSVEVVNERPATGGELLPGSGTGLLGLRERVALAGGRLEAGPAPGGGWRLAAWLPWPTRTEAPA